MSLALRSPKVLPLYINNRACLPQAGILMNVYGKLIAKHLNTKLLKHAQC